MKNLYLGLLLALVFVQCNFKRITYESFTKNGINDNNISISLDNVEVYYRIDSVKENNDISEKLQGYQDYQYLILKDDLVIYISTTPTPKTTEHQNYFLTDSINNKRKVPNSYYFNTFLIGRKTNDKIAFESVKEKKRANWNFEKKDDTIFFKNIEVNKKKYRGSDYLIDDIFVPDRSIDIGFAFKKLNYFDGFYFSDNYDMKKFADSFPKVESIILSFSEEELKDILVRYNKKIKDNGNDTEKYSKMRIKYYPKKDDINKSIISPK